MELCKELLSAAKGGNEEEVKKVLDEGASIDYHNEVGIEFVLNHHALNAQFCDVRKAICRMRKPYFLPVSFKGHVKSFFFQTSGI